jgi:regulator of extracellular matrix RemA (YlzA/DUF370 family)
LNGAVGVLSCEIGEVLVMMVSIGFGSYVKGDSIYSVLSPDGIPIRKLKNNDAVDKMLIDAAAGKKIKSVIRLRSNHILFSALLPETVIARLNGQNMLGTGEDEL